MVLVRFIGWALLLIGLIVLGRDLLAWYESGIFAPLSLGDLWRQIDGSGIVTLESGLSPSVWGVTRRALLIWAAPALLIPGIMLLWGNARERNPRRRRRR
jgi:hypothetical protein